MTILTGGVRDALLERPGNGSRCSYTLPAAIRAMRAATRAARITL